MANKRVLLGLGIIAGGVCAALPFRREAPSSESVRTNAVAGGETPLATFPTTVAKSADSPAGTAGPAAPSPYLDDGSQHLTGKTVSLPNIPAPADEHQPVRPRENLVPLPMLPLSFQVQKPKSEPWRPAQHGAGFLRRPQEYRIRKLDTLEEIAERLLGSKDRAAEIFDANRDVLKNPQVLPLGAVIRIPAEDEKRSATGDADGLSPLKDAAQK